ncbi:MAG: hypothetical protein NXY59_02435 [Aigarchaeota archaeon]|nr:hypothetical protein [Candidatus Pelearchaeum maunauluense]
MNLGKQVAGASALAAAAYAMALMKLGVSFPILPFLKFDFAEIPDTLSFLLFGWKMGLLTAVAHWLALLINLSQLTLAPPGVPQLMKLLAVLSMFVGLAAAQKLFARLHDEKKKAIGYTILGAITRTLIMAPIVFALYYILLPTVYLPFAKKMLTAAGFAVEGDFLIASMMTLLTSIFNALHAILIIPISYSIRAAVVRAIRPFVAQPQSR